MPDDPTNPTDRSQDARLKDLETAEREGRDHRTMVKTLLSLFSAAALLVVLGAVSVRDATLSTVARVTNVEIRVADVERAARARDTDDRGTREALVRLTVTVDALREQVEAMRSEMRDREHTIIAR